MKIKVRHLLMVASSRKYVATVRKMIRASVFEVETIWNIIFLIRLILRQKSSNAEFFHIFGHFSSSLCKNESCVLSKKKKEKIETRPRGKMKA